MPAFRHCLTASIVLLLALTAPPASAQVYAGRTANGTVVLSNFAGADTPTVIVSAPGAPTAVDAARASVPGGLARANEAISSIVKEVAREVDVPASLLDAVIAVESNYDARAVSSKGAQGLMQLMPATSQRFGVSDPFDPRDNVRGGAQYLKWLLELFGGDLQLVIAGYNAGEGAVIDAGYRVPPYAETQRFVPRVMARLQRG